MTIHVLLVSEQAAANLLPVLDPAMRPEEAVLVVSRRMEERAGALERALREGGVQRTTRLHLEDEHDFDAMQKTLLELGERMRGDAVALNLTGGTKLMALAAHDIAQMCGWRRYYLDLDTDEVVWLDRQATRRQAVNQHLRLRHYLLGYGFAIADGARPENEETRFRDLLGILVKHAANYGDAIGALNGIAESAFPGLAAPLDASVRSFSRLNDLLDELERAGVLKMEGNEIRFTSEDDRRFANGGWLELHVYQTLSKVQRDIGVRDKRLNLQVTDANGVQNELDVAFLARNRLHVIECKTQRLERRPARGGQRLPAPPKANDALFKLAELARRIGGIGARSMLVSFRSLGESEKELGHALGIEIVAVEQLARLDERLKQWCR